MALMCTILKRLFSRDEIERTSEHPTGPFAIKEEKKNDAQVKFNYTEEFKKMGGLEPLKKIRTLHFNKNLSSATDA
jgi:hypothetical protein